MRIGGIREVSQLYAAQSTKPKEKVLERKQDALNLSTQAKDYQYANQLLKDMPAIRTEQVEALRARIHSGNYTVDAKEVAQKMVSQFDMKG